LIDEHVSGEIWMVGVDARVNDGDLDSSARRKRPRIDRPACRRIDIREAPLRGEVRIVRDERWKRYGLQDVVAFGENDIRASPVLRQFRVDVLTGLDSDDFDVRRRDQSERTISRLCDLRARGCGIPELDENRVRVVRGSRDRSVRFRDESRGCNRCCVEPERNDRGEEKAA
jgi:hypothetical protein